MTKQERFDNEFDGTVGSIAQEIEALVGQAEDMRGFAELEPMPRAVVQANIRQQTEDLVTALYEVPVMARVPGVAEVLRDERCLPFANVSMAVYLSLARG